MQMIKKFSDNTIQAGIIGDFNDLHKNPNIMTFFTNTHIRINTVLLIGQGNTDIKYVLCESNKFLIQNIMFNAINENGLFSVMPL